MKIKPFRLERYYTLYEHSAKYSLCNSDCEAMTIKDLLALENGAEEQFHNLWLGYTETNGHPALRRDISAIYSKITAEQMTVCTGAQEPIFLFSHAVLNSGDEVIVQTPCYQSLQSVPESIGCKTLSWNVKYEGNRPTFDIDDLKKLVNNKTKVIYLNAPHNPTGFLFTKAEQQAIVEIARANNIIIFCDEVYRELEHSPKFAIPAFADAYENGVSVGVMSKSYGLPGLRIGWMVAPESFVEDAFKTGNDHLESIEYGLYNIHIQNFNSFYFAVVTHGVFDSAYKGKLESELFDFAEKHLTKNNPKNLSSKLSEYFNYDNN